MSLHLDFFALHRSPFADEAHTSVVIGTRALRKLVSRIQATLRDGGSRVGVYGVEGVGKTCLARALPKLFAGNARVATLFEPDGDWRSVRTALARDWQLAGERLSRASLLEAARDHRLVLVIDRAEQAPESLLDHLDVLQQIRDEDGGAVVTAILFVRSGGEGGEDGDAKTPALAWLERTGAARLRFEPLAPDSVADFIERQLVGAGYQGAPLFTPRATLAIHAETAGVPGAISALCEQLLIEAAAKRLRTLDEPFVRSRETPSRERVALGAEDGEEAWDDADHHPRESASVELLLEHAIRPPDPRPTERQPARAEDANPEDPELEAYLSAPPSAAELRAIRGGFLQRNARLFSAITAAVALGGVLVAHWLNESRADVDPASAAAAHEVVAAQPNGPAPTPSPAHPGTVLGRLRGPIMPAPVAAPRSSRAASRPQRGNLLQTGLPLRRSGDLVDDDAVSPPASALPDEDPEKDLPDLRPADLTTPGERSNSSP